MPDSLVSAFSAELLSAAADDVAPVSPPPSASCRPQFVEFHGVDDGITFCRKGLIADTPKAFPPKWIMKLVAKTYDSRSRETCVELNDFADSAEEVPGAQHPDSLRVWVNLGLEEVTERTPKAALWFAPPESPRAGSQ
eukprot:COSAG06_NODE_11652_length_1481_cov_1.237337_2_plen_138_part_00